MPAPLKPAPANSDGFGAAYARRRPSVSRGWRLAGMVAATAASLAAAVAGGFWAIFSPLVFDHQGNLLNPLAWIGFLLMITFWIVCVLAPFAAWVCWSRREEGLAWASMATPLAWVVAMFVVLQFVPK